MIADTRAIRRMAADNVGSDEIARRLTVSVDVVLEVTVDIRATRYVTTWMNDAEAGESFVYYVGDLAADREIDRHLDAVASAFLDASEKGLVSLFQKRVAPSTWAYTAVRKRPWDVQKLHRESYGVR